MFSGGERVRKQWHFFPLILLILIHFYGTGYAQNIRPATKAGQFYPANPIELREQVQTFIRNTFQHSIQGHIKAIWVPHAGYVFSGQVAGSAYAYLQNCEYDAIILIGPSHYMPLQGAAIGNWDAFSTPLGLISVDHVLSEKLLTTSSLVKCIPGAHKLEHSLEVQLPFIQTVLPHTPILPIVVGDLSLKQSRQLASDIVRICEGRNILLVASSDMSHYPQYKDAVRVDGQIIEAVEKMDSKLVNQLNQSLMRKRIPGLQCVMCGQAALVTVMMASKAMDAKISKVLPYLNSGDISGERSRVVGYGAALFIAEEYKMQEKKSVEDIDLSKEEIQRLFQIAREGIHAALAKKTIPEIDDLPENLQLKRGIFVTLTNQGRLRGCIGNFSPYASLAKMVQELAMASATQDYRFAYHPVTLDEMDKIDIKISILSELKKVNSAHEVEVGKHGIWIKQGGRSGTYLPEVATEMNWNREEFLSHCAAEKAGLSPDAWKEDAEIYVYTSQILNEKDL